MYKPCARSSVAYRDAKQAFERIDAAMAALRPNDDPRSVMNALDELSRSQCFEIGGGISLSEPIDDAIDSGLYPDSGAALKTFWESGGRDYVHGYLELAPPHSGQHVLWSQPDFRRTLSKGTRPGSPLAPLLCELTDSACENETVGWKTRALARFAVEAERARLAVYRASSSDGVPPRPFDFFECEEAALTAPARARFTRWVHCLSEFANKTLGFPLGGIHAPARGWLVVSGRRGHYDFCDELRAYDVAGGSAYVAQSCSELALVEGGSVDQRATDRARARRAKAGTVSLANLREAVWFLLVAPELKDMADAVGYHVPKGLELVYDSESDYVGAGWGLQLESSDQTVVDWRYLLDGKPLASGTLIWPGDTGEIAGDYAVELLNVAELSFQEGCAPRALPGDMLRVEPSPRAHVLDADPTSLRLAGGDLGAAWVDLTRRKPCRARIESRTR